MRPLRLWWPLLLHTACVAGEEQAPVPGTEDIASFADRAQPVFADRCANPSCHGNADRPLSLYAVHRYRLDSADVYADASLSDDELRHNLLQALVFTIDVSEASTCLLLTKPLHRHADVEVFSSTSDYDYRRLHAWIEGALAQGGDS